MIWFLINNQKHAWGEISNLAQTKRTFFVVFESTFCGIWKTNSKSHLSTAWCLLLTPRQSCFKAPSVCFMKNLSKNRVRVPIVNKTKAAVFGFHLPFTASRVKDIKIGRSWWKARWTTTSSWAKTRQHCRLAICMKLVELTNSDSIRWKDPNNNTDIEARCLV